MERKKKCCRMSDRFGIATLCLLIGYTLGVVTIMYRVVELLMLYALLLGVFCGYVAIGDIVRDVVAKIKGRRREEGEKA